MTYKTILEPGISRRNFLKLGESVGLALGALSLPSLGWSAASPQVDTCREDLVAAKRKQKKGATLIAARIFFHTNDDDKDRDTHVTVTVREINGIIAARVDSDFALFDDFSDAGPFSLAITDPGTVTELRGGIVTIRIDPNGDDSWRFNFFLDLLFSNGSHLSSDAAGLELTNNRVQSSFGIA
jgi:hypothetical protein